MAAATHSWWPRWHCAVGNGVVENCAADLEDAARWAAAHEHLERARLVICGRAGCTGREAAAWVTRRDARGGAAAAALQAATWLLLAVAVHVVLSPRPLVLRLLGLLRGRATIEAALGLEQRVLVGGAAVPDLAHWRRPCTAEDDAKRRERHKTRCVHSAPILSELPHAELLGRVCGRGAFAVIHALSISKTLPTS